LDSFKEVNLESTILRTTILQITTPGGGLDMAVGERTRWFAVYTSSRHEKCVALHFAERKIGNFLPLYRKTHRWKKRAPVSLELPLFPNYIFVNIAPRERNAVLGVPGVLAMVGRGPTPSALPDGEIESLRSGMESLRLEPHPYLVAGERVRISAGAMAGMEGILIRKKNEVRVVLTLDLIQRSVAVEVNADDVEPVGNWPRVGLVSATAGMN
jgi:transcription antitermination factor NusG